MITVNAAHVRCMEIDAFARACIVGQAFDYRDAMANHITVSLVRNEGRGLKPVEVSMVQLAVLTLWRDHCDIHGIDRRAIAGPLPRAFMDVADIPEIARSSGQPAVLSRESQPFPCSDPNIEAVLNAHALASSPGGVRTLLEVAAIAAPATDAPTAQHPGHPAPYPTAASILFPGLDV